MPDKSKNTDERTVATAEEVASGIVNSMNQLLKQLKGKDETASQLAAGKIFEFSGDLISAAESYRKVLGKYPDLHEAKARLALTFLRAQQPAEALPIAVELCATAGQARFSRLLNSRPFTAYTVLGDALKAGGKPDLAAEAYKKAISIEPKDDYSAGQYAQLLVSSGKLKEATNLTSAISAAGPFRALSSALTLAGNDPLLLPSITAVSSLRAYADMVV